MAKNNASITRIIIDVLVSLEIFPTNNFQCWNFSYEYFPQMEFFRTNIFQYDFGIHQFKIKKH